ncbi:MAG: hypothetical protein KF816_06535 [Melioribacteraceae bacterium]|nr:hypothetical protein [Melioribacteraceae bacterium]
MYAITIALKDKFEQMNISKHELAARMGYTNIMKGVQKITLFFRGEHYDEQLIKKMKKIIQLEENIERYSEFITQEQINNDKRICKLRDENDVLRKEILMRQKFIPFIYRKTEYSRPTSITMVALCGGAMKFNTLREDFMDKSFEDQKEFVSRFIKEDYRANGGLCRFFGKITGYYYQYSFDSVVEYDVDGKIIVDIIKDLILYPSPSARPYITLK